MSESARSIPAALFRSWYEGLEAIVSDDPHDVAEGSQHSALTLLLDLVAVGLRHGAIRPLVTHATGPVSHAYLTFRFPLDPAFDWSGTIALAHEAGRNALAPDQLIAEIAAATGLSAA